MSKDLGNMSIEELRRELINLARSQPTPGNVGLVALQTVLNARLAEAQAKAADDLVGATWKLFWATAALAVATAMTLIISVSRCA